MSTTTAKATGRAWLDDMQRATKAYATERRTPYSAQDTALLVTMLRAGRTIEEMCHKLGRTWHSVNGRISYLRRVGRIPRATDATQG